MDIQPTCPDLCLLTSRPRRLPLGSSNVLVHHCQLLAGKHIRGLSQQLHNPQGSGACSRPNVAMAHSSRSSVGCCSWLIAQIYSLDHTVLHSPPTLRQIWEKNLICLESYIVILFVILNLKFLSSSSFKLLKAVFLWVDLQLLLFKLFWEKK